MLDDLIDRERLSLLDRLGRSERRLQELGAQVAEEPRSDRQEWTPKEVLAHIAMFTGFYVQVLRQVTDGELADLDLMRKFQGRDVLGRRLLRRAPQELLETATAAIADLIRWLHSASPAAFRRGCNADMGDPDPTFFSVSDLVRLPLCAHLELHLDELQEALRPAH